MSQSGEKGAGRRSFLKNSALGIIGAGVIGSGALSAQEKAKKEEKPKDLPKIKEYRTLGKTGFKCSDVSLGGIDNEGIINALLDAGINYIDTAESYSNGNSEKAVGKALEGRDRKKIFITTKLVLNPEKETKETILNRFGKSMERMKVDYVDCLMMHSAANSAMVKHEGFHAATEQLKKEGKLRFVGISNHGMQWGARPNLEPMDKVLLAAVADGRYDVMLLVYNYLQQEQGAKILEACKKKNIGTTLMKTNPVGLYYLLRDRIEQLKKDKKNVPGFYTQILPGVKEQAEKAKPFLEKHNLKTPNDIRDASVKFVLNNKDVDTVCITFRSFDEVDGYLKLSGAQFTPKEAKALAAFKEGCGSFYCRHACGICEPSCPHGVPVNTIMRYNNYFENQGREKYAMQQYAALTGNKADKCYTCSGHCEKACPHNVSIHSLLGIAHDTLTLA